MMETLSLSWDAHQNSICSGLCLLQQRGEFVDMTLAADGHHVKVHQMVMCVVSPYIKDLIASAACPHPVIFLNNISYPTLSLILEYIYTGEVQLPKDKLTDLLVAGRALHIKGLKDMHDGSNYQSQDLKEINPLETTGTEEEASFETRKHKTKDKEKSQHMNISKIYITSQNENDDDINLEETLKTENDSEMKVDDMADGGKNAVIPDNYKEYNRTSKIQYSVSNQGGLQIIVNRFIYNLKYVQKNLNKYWRCVDYAYKKCPASVYTNDKNQVIRRKSTHNHPFHDKKILKKIQMPLIFGAYNEAADKAWDKKRTEKLDLVLLPSND